MYVVTRYDWRWAIAQLPQSALYPYTKFLSTRLCITNRLSKWKCYCCNEKSWKSASIKASSVMTQAVHMQRVQICSSLIAVITLTTKSFPLAKPSLIWVSRLSSVGGRNRESQLKACGYQGTSWLYTPEARPRSKLWLALATSRTTTTVLESLAKDRLRRLNCPWRHTWCIVAAALIASSGLIMEDGLAVVMEGAGGLGGGACDVLAMVWWWRELLQWAR